MQNGDSLNQLELLDRYLDGSLEAEASRQLEQELQKDESLRQQLDALIFSRDAIRSQVLRQRMRKLHLENMPKIRREGQVVPLSGKGSSRSVYFWPLRVAAALLIGILGYGALQYATLSPQTVYEEQYLSYQLPISRSTEYQISLLDSLYQQESYQALIQLYENKAETSRRDIFLAGLAYLETGQYEQAIDNFEQLQQTADEESATFRQETDYYLALAYLQNGQSSQALALFEQIRETAGHLYQNNISTTDLWKLRLLQLKD
jgi:tetratricopeptide (TPR) repeat protein